MLKIMSILFIFSSCTQAARLVPIPFKKQLNESEGIILGQFLAKSYKKMHTGNIVTEASFKIIKSIGVGNRFLLNKNVFKIYYDGGQYQGYQYDNENSPKFIDERTYVILLKRDNFGFRPYMEKLGVYTINDTRESRFLVSQAFPEHPKIGIIPYHRFSLWVRSVYGEALSDTHSDKYVYRKFNNKSTRGRAPASIGKKLEAEPHETTIGIFWVTFIFGALGAMRMRKIKANR